jgi:hypothetical protein
MFFSSGRMRRRDMNIWNLKKRDEELNYTRNNAVRRGLVKYPSDRPWSRRGGRFYFWNDASMSGMDKML